MGETSFTVPDPREPVEAPPTSPENKIIVPLQYVIHNQCDRDWQICTERMEYEHSDAKNAEGSQDNKIIRRPTRQAISPRTNHGQRPQ